MKYISIDIETTGLDSERHEILSIGAILEDTTKKLPKDECPKFYAIIPRNEITGSPVAMQMNAQLIDDIAEFKKKNPKLVDNKCFMEEDMVAKNFYDWLYTNGIVGERNSINVQMRNIMGDDGEMHRVPEFGKNSKNIRINVAGKNFGTFDKLFLQKLPWWKKLISMNQRILDPAILFVDWDNDFTLPNLKECKDRANINGIVTHNALDDAWDVVELLRKNY